MSVKNKDQFSGKHRDKVCGMCGDDYMASTQKGLLS